MMFLTLNNGKRLNLMRVSSIKRNGTDIEYTEANNYLGVVSEHFDTEEEAIQRETELSNL